MDTKNVAKIAGAAWGLYRVMNALKISPGSFVSGVAFGSLGGSVVHNYFGFDLVEFFEGLSTGDGGGNMIRSAFERVQQSQDRIQRQQQDSIKKE